MQRLQRIVQGLSAELGPEGSGVPDALRDLEEADAVGMLLACAYPDRIAQRRDRGSATGSATAFLLSSGRGVTFPQSSSDPMALEGARPRPARRGLNAHQMARSSIVLVRSCWKMPGVTEARPGSCG